MNIHTRFVGAIDAIILSLTAAVTIGMVVALLDPRVPAPNDTLVEHYSVTIEQLPS